MEGVVYPTVMEGVLYATVTDAPVIIILLIVLIVSGYQL
jgi:hypothetical protein